VSFSVSLLSIPVLGFLFFYIGTDIDKTGIVKTDIVKTDIPVFLLDPLFVTVFVI
jgi:hypothetical protein